MMLSLGFIYNIPQAHLLWHAEFITIMSPFYFPGSIFYKLPFLGTPFFISVTYGDGTDGVSFLDPLPTISNLFIAFLPGSVLVLDHGMG